MSWLLLRLRRVRLLRLHSARGSAPVSSLPSSSSFSSAATFWNAAYGTHRCQQLRPRLCHPSRLWRVRPQKTMGLLIRMTG